MAVPVLPPRPAVDDRDPIQTDAPGVDGALVALMGLAPLLVPGCTGACIEVVVPSSRVIGDPEGGGADAVRLALLSGLADAEGELLGVLSLFGARSFGLDAAEPAARLAEGASAVLAAELDSLKREGQLKEALLRRDLIGQAKGILMAQSRVDADTAFTMLARASQRSNRKVRDVAADIVERHLARSVKGTT